MNQAPLVNISVDMSGLENAVARYGAVSDKSEAEVIAKQSAKLAFEIYKGMRGIAPPKGFTEPIVDRMRSGDGGLRVRRSVIEHVDHVLLTKYQQKLIQGASKFGSRQLNWWQMAVARELAIRKSARMFTAYSTPRPARGEAAVENVRTLREVESKYGQTLSDFELNTSQNAERKFARLRWIGSASNVTSPTDSLMQARQQAVLQAAVNRTTADILEYVNKKVQEDIKSVGWG